jgi:hypothetical protein
MRCPVTVEVFCRDARKLTERLSDLIWPRRLRPTISAKTHIRIPRA